MMRTFQKTIFCAVFPLCLVLFFGAGTLRGEDETVESFKAKAPAAWARYLESLKNIEVTWYSETIKKDETETSKPSTVYHNPPYHLSISQSDVLGTVASGNNKRYSFRLSSKDGKTWGDDQTELFLPNSDGPLQFFKPGERGNGKILRELVSWDTLHLAAALNLNFFIWFPSYVNEEDFQVLEVENLYEDDLHLVRVKYSYEPKEFDPNIHLRSGEVFLLPDYDWVIKRAAFKSMDVDQTQADCQTEIEYNLAPGKLALPSVVTVKFDEDNFTMRWHYTWKEGCTFDKKMFTLSHFGLDEPDFGEGRVNRLRIIMSLLGALLIVSALYKIYQSRKRRGL